MIIAFQPYRNSKSRERSATTSADRAREAASVLRRALEEVSIDSDESDHGATGELCDDLVGDVHRDDVDLELAGTLAGCHVG
jgi:hypothetical protein